MEIRRVGIVGCGTMGAGIAQLCAQSGYQVVVSEINETLLNKGLTSIDNILSKGVERGKLSQEDKDSVMSHIKGTTDTKDFHDCDLMIEAAVENLELKRKIFAELDEVCPEHTILATNTSCLPITDMAAVTRRPDKVLGLHFMNPVPIMKLLEIVRTITTSDETLEIGKAFGKSLDKTIVVAPDTPGFIINRLFVPFMLNAVRMLEAGVASREDIDTAISLGLNHPMGPLTLADFSGIDVVSLTAQGIYEEFKDPQYITPTLMNRMITAGWLGRKTGKGFYDYK